MDDLTVIVPDPQGRGVTVCTLSDLLSELMDSDGVSKGQSLDEVLTNAAYDSTTTRDELETIIHRVQRANNGGDYWEDT